jgi:hypothetical protein
MKFSMRLCKTIILSKYKIVHADDLLNTIEQTYGEDIIPIYETWITK